MDYGFEVEWVSAYKPDKYAEAAGDFQALKFARKIRRKAVVIKVAWIREFREQPDEHAPARPSAFTSAMTRKSANPSAVPPCKRLVFAASCAYIVI